MIVHVYNPSTLEAGARSSGLPRLPGLLSVQTVSIPNQSKLNKQQTNRAGRWFGG